MVQQDALAQALEAQAVVSVECDVPIGWSLDDYRQVRGLAREVIREPAPGVAAPAPASIAPIARSGRPR